MTVNVLNKDSGEIRQVGSRENEKLNTFLARIDRARKPFINDDHFFEASFDGENYIEFLNIKSVRKYVRGNYTF